MSDSDTTQDDIKDDYDIRYKLNGLKNADRVISKNNKIALKQYETARVIQIESAGNKANVLDGLSIMTAFLVAFAYSDMSQLDQTSFKSSILFILYSITLMVTITTGTLTLIAVTFILVKLRRLIQRDTSRQIYWKGESILDSFRKDYKTASHARAWYYGIDKNGNKMKGGKPHHVIAKSVKLFLVMLTSYVIGLFVKSLDLFWNYNDDNNHGFLAIPITWIVITVTSFIFLLRWLHIKECITDIA